MNRSALGLVEVYGYLSAVEALDVCLKSANVQAVGCEFVSAGIVTIKITGDVAAVKAAVEASEAAVQKLGTLITSHVIARLSDEVWNVITDKEEEEECTADNQGDNSPKEDNNNNIEVSYEDENKDVISEEFAQEKIVVEIINNNEEQSKDIHKDEVAPLMERLAAMKVSELRSLARSMETDLTKKQIKFAKKGKLIEAILQTGYKEV